MKRNLPTVTSSHSKVISDGRLTLQSGMKSINAEAKDDGEKEESDVSDDEVDVISERTETEKEELVVRDMLSKKWVSEPLLHVSDLVEQPLENEKDIECQTPRSRLPSTPRAPGTLPPSPSPSNQMRKRVVHSAKANMGHGRVKALETVQELHEIDPKTDLQNLLAKQTHKDEDEIVWEDGGLEDIPPLIQAITRREVQDANMKKLKQIEKEIDERRRITDEEERKPLPEPKFPQPAIVKIKLPGFANPIDSSAMTIRTTDVHIPDKVELPQTNLQTYGPLYNDLTGEITPSVVKDLDANLFQGEELVEVYSEIMKTLEDDHLLSHLDSIVVEPSDDVDVNKCLASNTLHRPKSQRVVNHQLVKSDLQPTWMNEQNEWTKGIHINKVSRDTLDTGRQSGAKRSALTNVSRAMSGHSHSAPPPSRSLSQHHHHAASETDSRDYASWLAWWKATISTDDYFKFLSTQETDYLGVVFHFYNSEGTLTEVDHEAEQLRLEKERIRAEKLEKIKEEKERFFPGLWNVNAVMLGGLGGYPSEDECCSDDETEATTQTGLNRSLGSAKSIRTEKTMRSEATTPRTKTTRTKSSMSATAVEPVTLQMRLEVVWKKLKVSIEEKMNYALKYSSDKYLAVLDESVECWEKVTELILKRERCLGELEIIERDASNPQRFFAKDASGSSVARLKEEKLRSKLHKKMSKLENIITPLLKTISREFGDHVTFEGRNYSEKMTRDKVEMLYWLQQERRCKMLASQGHPQQWDHFVRNNVVPLTPNVPQNSRINSSMVPAPFINPMLPSA